MIKFFKYFKNFGFLFLIVSCYQESSLPKPKSYLRIDFPKKEYYQIKVTCSFIFKIPNYSSWEQKFKNYPNCNKTIIFPEFKAEVLCDYISLNNNLFEISEEFRKMVYEHSFKSSAIIERTWESEINKVYALAYEIKGNTACNYAFTITDSVSHFFSGQLLFQSKPNYDSLHPSIFFLKSDIENMIYSFRWVN